VQLAPWQVGLQVASRTKSWRLSTVVLFAGAMNKDTVAVTTADGSECFNPNSTAGDILQLLAPGGGALRSTTNGRLYVGSNLVPAGAYTLVLAPSPPPAALRPGVTEDYSGFWFMSDALSSAGLRTPWEQYGFYAITGTGFMYGARSWIMARDLMQAMASKDEEALQEVTAQYKLKKEDLRYAHWAAKRFRLRAVSAALGAPLLWLAWRRAARLEKQR